MTTRPTIMLFHRDLRLDDNPALAAAARAGGPVIAVFVFDPEAAGAWPPGGASRWWLHHSLAALSGELGARGLRLILRTGDTVAELEDLVARTDSTAIHFNRGYEPWLRPLENRIHQTFKDKGVDVRRYGGRLLVDPDAIRTKDGAVYKVYSPFWRALMKVGVRAPVPPPEALVAYDGQGALASDTLEDWHLLPTRPNWAVGFSEHWTPGVAGAAARFDAFIEGALSDYDEMRNRPDVPGTSRLSPHFHYGELSPARAFHRALPLMDRPGPPGKGAETYLKELVWREFSYHLLYHFPHLPEAPYNARFAEFPWEANAKALRAWQRGMTGYPIVDAGMRELWRTGWMHNRVRMIVASFLTKNLLIPWQEGEAWFWDCLVDADLASNSASWQWVAGSGADAAPYFRIFNPVKQAQKFDPDGAYVRRWVPELTALPARHIHAPWEAPAEILEAAGVRLGESYPQPLVDHGATRDRALAAYAHIKLKAS